MSILQQLSEIKLEENEIREVISICEHAVNVYTENLESLDKVIELYESTGNEGIIKMMIETDDGMETKRTSIEDVKIYRQQIIDDNEQTIRSLESCGKKLKMFLQILD